MKLVLNSGIKIRGIFDRKQGNQKWAASHNLLSTGAELFKN